MFRLVNVNGRAALERDGRWYDLAELSGDATLADPLAAVARHRELHALARTLSVRDRRRPDRRRRAGRAGTAARVRCSVSA